MKRRLTLVLLVCLAFTACKPRTTPTATPTRTPVPVLGKVASDVRLHVGPSLDDGEMGVLATFFGLSILSGFALKGVFGVTL